MPIYQTHTQHYICNHDFKMGERKLKAKAADAETKPENIGQEETGMTTWEILSSPPPADEPEFISHATANRNPQLFWAPLISGTTTNEMIAINKEIRERSATGNATRGPANENKLLDKETNYAISQMRTSANKPMPDLANNPSGSQTPHDAIESRDRPMSVRDKSTHKSTYDRDDEALSQVPEEVLSKMVIPVHIRPKASQKSQEITPESAQSNAMFQNQIFGAVSPADGARTIPPRAAEDVGFAAEISKQAILSQDTTSFNGIKDTEPGGKYDSPTSSENTANNNPLPTSKACTNCVTMGVKCHLRSTSCFWCFSQGFQCSLSVSDTRTLQQPARESQDSSLPQLRNQTSTRVLGNRPVRSQVTRKAPRHQKRLPRSPAFHKIFPTRMMSSSDMNLQKSHADQRNSPLQEDNFHARPSIRITIPDLLKNLLVDDWENVTKSLQLVPLPSQAPANFILDSYFNEEKSNRRLGSPEADILEEFIAGMKVYFDKSLGKILLYRFERNQLGEVSQYFQKALSDETK